MQSNLLDTWNKSTLSNLVLYQDPVLYQDYFSSCEDGPVALIIMIIWKKD